MGKADDILNEAKRIASESTTWADLSNAIFAPFTGLIATTFPDEQERKAFRKSPTYDALHELVRKKMEETGLIEGATPTKSGRFVVRPPRSMHAALEQEALAEGTSLNQLVLAKLAVQLSTVVSGRKRATSRPGQGKRAQARHR